MKKQYYQQGDVLLFKTKAFDPNDTLYSGRKKFINKRTPILQHGEATGHAHRIDSPGYKLYESAVNTDIKVLVLKTFGLLSHEEHKPIRLPRGIYEISIVREYDHFQKVIRRVVD